MSIKLEFWNYEEMAVLFELPSKKPDDPARVHSGFSISEDDKVEIHVTAPLCCRNLQLFLTDIPLSPSESILLNGKTKVCHKWRSTTRNIPLFCNLFGEISVAISYTENNTPHSLKYQSIDIIGNKLSRDTLFYMIKYLVNKKAEDIWSICSLGQIPANIEGDRDCLQFIREAEVGLEVLNRALPAILRAPCSRLIPTQNKIQTTHSTIFDGTSIEWLVANLDVFEPTPSTPESVNLLGRSYFPSEIMQTTLVEDADIYENQVVLGYIHLVINFLSNFHQKFGHQCNSEPLYNSNKKQPLYKILQNENKKIFSTYIQKSESLLDGFRKHASAIKKHLNISTLINDPPVFTAKARKNTYYLRIFKQVAIWHSLGTPNWRKLEAYSGIKSIDQIYESYCFHRLSDAIETAGFSSSSQGEEALTVTSQQASSFKSAYYNINLYHERAFYSEQATDSNEEFCHIERWRHDTSSKATLESSVIERVRSKKHSHRRPDFVIEIYRNDNPSEKRLLIFDAKYTDSTRAHTNYLPSCVMKYVHGIGKTAGGPSPVLLFYILFSGAEYFQQPIAELHFNNDNLDDISNLHTPCIGCVELSPRENWGFDSFINNSIELAKHSFQAV